MTTVSPKILLAATSTYYPAARLVMALSKAGCSVDAVCPVTHPLRKTKAIARVHAYHGLAPLTSFARAIASTQPDFLVSADDLATQHVHELYARERQKGKQGAPLCALIERSLGESRSFSVVSMRAAFMDMARSAGVCVPATQLIADRESLATWISQTGLPTVLKADGTSGGDGVRIVHTLSEAERAFRDLQSPPMLARAVKRALVDHDKTLVWPSILRHRRAVMAQAFVAGQEATSTVVCWNGAVLASLHFQVVNKVNSTGHATVMRLIDNAGMQAAVECVAQRLGLSGFYGFDFMLEGETQTAYLIEVNPRATQVGHLSLGAGRDLPAALSAAWSGQSAQPGSAVTDNDTIALFPQEWIRDPQSTYLQSAYHDVPWEEPELIRDCVSNRDKQSAWYSRPKRKPANSAVRACAAVSVPLERGAVQLECRSK
jgi:hypothetical protein